LINLPARYYCRYPFEAPAGLVKTRQELETDRTVFMLVDVYGKGFDAGDAVPNFPPLFLHRQHPVQAEMVRERIRPSLDTARLVGLPVVYVENRWHPAAWENSEFGQLEERTECGFAGTFDEVCVNTGSSPYSDVIAPRSTDLRVEKTMYDGFFGTTLDAVLHNLKAKYLVCVGFAADICLLTTVIGAMYRNYRVIVLRDAVLGAEYVDTVEEGSMTKWAIRHYETLVGFTSTTEEFIESCDAYLADASSPEP
jgi:nicotinamidase-related amidase